jgi:hypothetical protein
VTRGYVLLGITSLCGATLTVYLHTEVWKLLRRAWRALTPSQRRNKLLLMLATFGAELGAIGPVLGT